MAFLTLDLKGIVAALALGFLMLFFGHLNVLFVAFMLYFLLLSALVTNAGMGRKHALGVYEKSRSVANVLSNGVGPLIFSFVFFAAMLGGASNIGIAALAGFGASVASVTSDKFSSELGVLDGQPKDILTLKSVKKGASGGITHFGLASGLFAALLISVPFAFVVFKNGILLPGGPAFALYALVTITIGGFIGTIVDSVLGHFEEKGIGNKFTSNFICSICGGLVGMLFLALVL